MEVENVLSDLIRIESVNPPGGEIEVARYLKRLFDEHGIPNEVIESSPGRGSFLASIGEGERSLLFLAHTDVVPVSEGWSFGPFSGEIKDGFVHGRGALDCKGLVAAQAYAAIQLAQSAKLGGRLIFAATADEEAGGVWGMKWLVENRREKVMADFSVTEGGWNPMRIGGETCHFIQIGEKGIIRPRVTTKGVSAHGSVPVFGDNAVVKMAGVIKRLAEYRPVIILTPEVKHLIQTMADLEGLEGDVTEANVDQFIGRLQDRALAGYLMAITRMTVSPNVVRGGMKVNIIPDSCEAEVDVRVLPGQDGDYLFSELGSAFSDAEVEIVQSNMPSFSGTDTEPYKLILNTMKESLDGVLILPCVSSGGTDSRHLRGQGIPCYGIGMMALNLNPEMRQSIHGRDEKVDIDSLRLKSEFLKELALKYLGVR